MSIKRINQYYNELFQVKKVSGQSKESSIRRYFANLLSEYAADKKLLLIDEVTIPGLNKKPDGVLMDNFQFRYGYWEAKDSDDDLEKELQKKINSGYPIFNLLIENSKNAILVRNEQKTYYDISDAQQLHQLLTSFVSYERQEANKFKEALEKFKKDLPQIIDVLRKMIQAQIKEQEDAIKKDTAYNVDFVEKRRNFYELCQVSINPHIKYADIDEMLIQHILTEEIFKTVFSDTQFHEENNISQALNSIESTFFKGTTKRETLGKISSYYEAIKIHSTNLKSHDEKQDFLKSIYENFYQAYNPKGADKLGIVYTPSQVVNFMIESTDYLLEQYFGKNLSDKGVEILDPATGTGTFITDLLNYLPPSTLTYKYQNEIHANELAILPYYIANLNIEYIYNQRMGHYLNFNNLCWVDTLDNTDALGFVGKTLGKIGGVNAENYRRIQEQNKRKLSVIIGNPPYNANQQNENDDNKNRAYYENYTKKTGGIDGRIKDTYVKESKAQKTKVYDMYARFYRWATDRMSNDGIIAFVTNRSFIDSSTFDGFRKCVQDDFDAIYIIDTKSDVRLNPRISGTKNNIFGIQTGVAVTFMIKNSNRQSNKLKDLSEKKPTKIFYYTLEDEDTKQEKLKWFKETKFEDIDFATIKPDENYNWLNISKSDFKSLLPLVESDNTNIPDAKLLHFTTLGVSTNRDEWVFDFDKENLKYKIEFFIDNYNRILKKHTKKNWEKLQKSYERAKQQGIKVSKPILVDEPAIWETTIKWSRDLKEKFLRKADLKLDENKIIIGNYRPFTKQFYYSEKIMNDVLTQNHYQIFGSHLNEKNKYIAQIGHVAQKPFTVLIGEHIPSLNYLSAASGCYLYPLYYFENNIKINNITDWGLEQFVNHYQDKEITKEDIFNYIYAVLHSPSYRTTYEIDLKRDFPRIPFYQDFWLYANAGKELMDLHLNYETIKPEQNDVKVVKLPPETLLPKRKSSPNPLFEKDKDQEDKEILKKIKPDILLRKKGSLIEIDSITSIQNVPQEVWEYRLGNRSAVEWILDQYKPYTSKDESIQKHFNNYDFEDHKEKVIDLLLKVIVVSKKTVEILKKLE